MPNAEATMRALYEELQEGDRVEILHRVKVGQKEWETVQCGAVVRKERRRHGLHHQRNVDDKVYSDILVLRRDDGELTTVTMDEYSSLRRP